MTTHPSPQRTDFFWTVVICSGTLLVSFFLCGVLLLQNARNEALANATQRAELLADSMEHLLQPVAASADLAEFARLTDRMTAGSGAMRRISLEWADGMAMESVEGVSGSIEAPEAGEATVTRHLALPGGKSATLLVTPRQTADTGVVPAAVLWRTLGICVTTAMITLAGAGFLSDRMRQPLRSLEKLAREYGAGNFAERWSGSGSAEVHHLAGILHSMAAQLSEHQETIAAHSARVESANEGLRQEVAVRTAAETELKRRVSTERAISRLAADLLHRDGVAMDRAVGNSLGEICELTDASGAAIYLRENGQLQRQWAWIASGSGTLFPTLVPGELLPWNASDEGLRHAVMVVNPPTADESPGKRPGLVSALGAPAALVVAVCDAVGRPSGFLVLRREEAERWAECEIHLIQLAGDILSHAIARAEAAAEREKLQDQLLHSQKMEAVGKLSGGIAHDFNNMLVPIIGYSDSILSTAAPDAPWLEELREIKRAAQSAASLTRQLLTFSRKQITSRAELNLNGLLDDLRKMLHRLLGENVQVETRLDPQLWTVLADAGQMEQCIVNLAVNARHAMPGGGRIVIATAAIDHEDPDFAPPPGRKVQGVFVRLSVTDSGCGMDEVTLRRIFEPFFTTKGHDGTGLGLSVVHGVMEEHAGWVVVRSRLGAGSSFHLYLPALHEPAELEIVAEPVAPAALSPLAALPAASPAPVAPARPAPALPARGNGQCILLIEDEAGVMLFVSAALRKHGYQVLTAEDGSMARTVFADNREQINLVISDVVLPDCSGPDLLDEFMPGNPQIRYMLSSGYSERASLVDFVQKHGIVFLHKPYALNRLLEAVEHALAGGTDMIVA